jgi:hypothetical protein
MKIIRHGCLSFGPEALGIMLRKTLVRSLIPSGEALTTMRNGCGACEPRTGKADILFRGSSRFAPVFIDIGL